MVVVGARAEESLLPPLERQGPFAGEPWMDLEKLTGS